MEGVFPNWGEAEVAKEVAEDNLIRFKGKIEAIVERVRREGFDWGKTAKIAQVIYKQRTWIRVTFYEDFYQWQPLHLLY